jgi:F-type H+-transporting ATPase subunit delta
MIAAEVARRYAHGLFLLALEKNAVDLLAGEMRDVDNLLKVEKSLLSFLAAPQVRDHDKVAALRAIFSGKVSKMLEEFLLLVVSKRRDSFLHEIAEEFDELVLEHNGYVKTRVITAIPLSDSEREMLVQKLEAKSGKKVRLYTEIDAAIIGGVVVFLGDKIIDKSIRHQLDLLRNVLETVKVH